MRVTFADGVSGRLVAISKSANYRQGFRGPPTDPKQAVVDLAVQFIPSGWPPHEGQLTLLGSPEEILSMIERRTLPEVLVVAEFVAQLVADSGGRKTGYRRFAWLQRSLDDDISQDNRGKLESLTWLGARKTLPGCTNP